jgi:hypothetical protein
LIPSANLNLGKYWTTSIFVLICILGITAGFFPSRCVRKINLFGDLNSSKKILPRKINIRLRGHHPTCGNFSSHVLQVGHKTYCAGCVGLVAGAVLSLFGCFFYFFIGLPNEVSMFIFWLGFISVCCGLLQHIILKWFNGTSHFFLNILFVLGAFFLMVGVNEMTNTIVIDFYLFALIIYFILSRMTLSQLEHHKICSACTSKTCNFFHTNNYS